MILEWMLPTQKDRRITHEREIDDLPTDITNLICMNLDDRSINKLSKFKNLSELSLAGTSFSDEALQYLKSLDALKDLSLFACSQLTDQGLEYVSWIKSLQRLDLRYCSVVGDNGIRHLKNLINS